MLAVFVIDMSTFKHEIINNTIFQPPFVRVCILIGIFSFHGVRAVIGFCILMRGYCYIYLGGAASGKGLFFNTYLHVSFLPHHKTVQPRIEEWRLGIDSWLLCSTVGYMPYLNHLLIEEICIGNFQIRYRTGSSRLFHLHKNTGIILERMEGQGTATWQRQWRYSYVSEESYPRKYS